MIVEDIVFQKGDWCEGRIRSKEKKFDKKHVAIIVDEQQKEILKMISSQDLFIEAKTFADEINKRTSKDRPSPGESSAWLVDRLFMTASDDLLDGTFWPYWPGERYGMYVDKGGQLASDSLHLACFNRDRYLAEFLLKQQPEALREKRDFIGIGETNSKLGWKNFHGTPLTAAANAYVAIKHHPRLHSRTDHAREAQEWIRIFKFLTRDSVKGRSLWDDFADGQPLLGPGSSICSNGQSLLARAIYYNDHSTFKLLVNATQNNLLRVERLPCSTFFDLRICAGFAVEDYGDLTAAETAGVLKILYENTSKIRRGQDHLAEDLQEIVPFLIWSNIRELTIDGKLLAKMLYKVLRQSCSYMGKDSGIAGSNLGVLLACKTTADLNEWAAKCSESSVMHYAARTGDLQIFMALCKAKETEWINKEDARGHTPLDIAERMKFTQLADYIRSNGGGNGHLSRTCTPATVPVTPIRGRREQSLPGISQSAQRHDSLTVSPQEEPNSAPATAQPLSFNNQSSGVSPLLLPAPEQSAYKRFIDQGKKLFSFSAQAPAFSPSNDEGPSLAVAAPETASSGSSPAMSASIHAAGSLEVVNEKLEDYSRRQSSEPEVFRAPTAKETRRELPRVDEAEWPQPGQSPPKQGSAPRQDPYTATFSTTHPSNANRRRYSGGAHRLLLGSIFPDPQSTSRPNRASVGEDSEGRQHDNSRNRPNSYRNDSGSFPRGSQRQFSFYDQGNINHSGNGSQGVKANPQTKKWTGPPVNTSLAPRSTTQSQSIQDRDQQRERRGSAARRTSPRRQDSKDSSMNGSRYSILEDQDSSMDLTR